MPLHIFILLVLPDRPKYSFVPHVMMYVHVTVSMSLDQAALCSWLHRAHSQ